MDKRKDVISGRFIWSKWKSDRNVSMGRPPFSAAMSVFCDKNAMNVIAKDGKGPRRYGLYGKSNRGMFLLVIFAYHEKRIRLISVREDSKLREQYDQKRKS